MNRRHLILALLVAITAVAGVAAAQAQATADDEAAWRTFLSWVRDAPGVRNPFGDYAAALKANGMAAPDVEKRLALLRRMFFERSDWVEVYFDKAFSKPVTGTPAEDGFSTAPSVLLVEAVKGLTPGAALDAGMGQGRNAVYLAGQGWRVSGFDLSGEALSAARANADRAHVKIEASRATYADFPFGTAKWDLIVLAFAWAPVTDAAFVATLRNSLRPGGRVVFEHFLEDPESPRPAVMHALKPGQLRRSFQVFEIERYEEVEDLGDWGGPGMHLVRMVAVKK